MAATNLEDARDALKQLFDIMGIKRVVFVDDEYRLNFEDIFGKYAIANQEQLKEIELLKETPFTEDHDLKRVNLQKLWGKLANADRYSLSSQLSKTVGIPEEEETEVTEPNAEKLDIIAIPTLRTVFDSSFKIDFKELSFAEWKEKGAGLLNEVKTSKTIFLFDQDLSKEGGSDKEGIKLIQDVLGKTKGQENQVICGLLSHTFSVEQAYDQWKKFAADNHIDENRFILVAKGYLAANLLGFAHMLKLMILNNPCKELIKSASSIIKGAHEKARDSINDINIYDFDHIVFRSSHQEGVWEPDTLFRLFGIYHRDVAQHMARNNKKIRELASQIREVSSVPSEPLPSSYGKSWRIQRLELYESGEHINKLHMPLELGDIFQKKGGTKKYILLAQPCDLMVRLEGENRGKRRPNMNEVILAEIVANEQDGSKGFCYELPFFDEKTGETYYVAFRRTHTVDLLVLDLCVYQDDGSSTFSMDDKCLENIIPAWRFRHEKILQSVKKEIERYIKLKANIADKQLLGWVNPKSSNDNLFKATIDDSSTGKETLSYTCKRVGRLCQSRASTMLTAYANYIARAAFEHEFAVVPR